LESHLFRRGPVRFFYERELVRSYPKLREFAKQEATGAEAKINARLDRGHSRRIAGYIAARKWGGLLPSQFDALSDYDRGWILATLRIENLFEAHVSKVQREVSEEESGKKSSSSRGAGYLDM